MLQRSRALDYVSKFTDNYRHRMLKVHFSTLNLTEHEPLQRQLERLVGRRPCLLI
jgi:hypothetical protein